MLKDETRERTLYTAIVALEEAAEVMTALAESKSEDSRRRLQHAAENNILAAKKIRELREWVIMSTRREFVMTQPRLLPACRQASSFSVAT